MNSDGKNLSRHNDVNWQTRYDMILHALKRSLPWFIVVNISFALMVLLRGLLFGGIDGTLPSAHALLPWLDAGMMLIVVAATSLPLVVLKLNDAIIWRRYLPAVLLCTMSIIWSAAAFGFVAVWELPFGWPLVCILLLSGLTALYFTPLYLLSFILPLWLTLPFISEYYNQSINPRFVAVWIILSGILAYGRHNLQRWFNEAWARYAENQILIDRLNQLASQDALTGLANRRALEQHMKVLRVQECPFALLMLDVDYFKRYNDHYGHQAGDACLAKVADAMNNSVRTPADLVARYGGEEFVVVLPAATLDEATLVADRIQKTLLELSLPHAASGVGNTVTVSMGIALAEKNDSASGIIARADKALYRAKQQGRNRWVK